MADITWDTIRNSLSTYILKNVPQLILGSVKSKITNKYSFFVVLSRNNNNNNNNNNINTLCCLCITDRPSLSNLCMFFLSLPPPSLPSSLANHFNGSYLSRASSSSSLPSTREAEGWTSIFSVSAGTKLSVDELVLSTKQQSFVTIATIIGQQPPLHTHTFLFLHSPFWFPTSIIEYYSVRLAFPLTSHILRRCSLIPTFT